MLKKFKVEIILLIILILSVCVFVLAEINVNKETKNSNQSDWRVQYELVNGGLPEDFYNYRRFMSEDDYKKYQQVGVGENVKNVIMHWCCPEFNKENLNKYEPVFTNRIDKVYISDKLNNDSNIRKKYLEIEISIKNEYELGCVWDYTVGNYELIDWKKEDLGVGKPNDPFDDRLRLELFNCLMLSFDKGTVVEEVDYYEDGKKHETYQSVNSEFLSGIITKTDRNLGIYIEPKETIHCRLIFEVEEDKIGNDILVYRFSMGENKNYSFDILINPEQIIAVNNIEIG